MRTVKVGGGACDAARAVVFEDLDAYMRGVGRERADVLGAKC